MEILDSIREEEKRAEELKQNARLESDQMLTDAESQAREEAAGQIASARRKAEILLNEALEAASEERRKRLTESAQSDAELVGASRSRMEDAVDFILRQIMPEKGA